MTGKVTQKSHCKDKKISVELAHHLFYSDIGVTLSFLYGVITMNQYTGRQARPQASINSLKWLWISCQILLLSSFTLLSGCGGGDSSSSSSASSTTSTSDTAFGTVNETPMFEGFTYLDTAWGTDPRQQETNLLKIKGVDSATCDGYECNFTFNGRKALYIYPLIKPDLSQQSLSIATTHDAFLSTENIIFGKNVVSAFSENRLCPSASQKNALILAPVVGSYEFPSDPLDPFFDPNDGVSEVLLSTQRQLEQLGYQVDVKIGAEANLEAFEDLSKSRDKYGLIYIAAHSNQTGTILTGEPVCHKFSGTDCLAKTKIIEGEKNGYYIYSEAHGKFPAAVGITPEWWNIMKVAGESSKNQFYFFQSCKAFAPESGLLKYFRENSMNGVGLNQLSPVLNLPQRVLTGIQPYSIGNFYLDILKHVQSPDVSILSAVNTLKHDAGKICMKEWKQGVLASECIVTVGNPNLYLLPNTCSSITPANIPPSVSILKPFTNSKFSVGTSVVFEGTVADKDGSVVTYGWDFEGNGQYAVTNALSTAYTYTKAGIYKVTLRAQDNQGATNTATVQIEITNPTPPVTPPPVSTNGAPVVSNFIVPASAKVNQQFTMNVSYSDPNGNNDVVQAVIQADDDYPKLHSFPITYANGIYSMSVAFDSVGQHWVSVYVVDSAGNKSNEMKRNITITSDAPNPAPTPADSTSLSGTYSGTKTYMAGAEAGTTYNITISSLSETSTMLSGTYTVTGYGGSSLSGMRTGNTVNFSTKPAGNPTCTHTFMGTISNNAISGTMTTANNCNGSGTWTVTKK